MSSFVNYNYNFMLNLWSLIMFDHSSLAWDEFANGQIDRMCNAIITDIPWTRACVLCTYTAQTVNMSAPCPPILLFTSTIMNTCTIHIFILKTLVNQTNGTISISFVLTSKLLWCANPVRGPSGACSYFSFLS